MDDYISGWNDWEEALVDWTDVTISELHGLITGVLSVCDAPKAEEWQTLLAALSFSELEEKPLELVTEEGEDITAILTDENDSYQFMPLVPDDEHPLNERLRALSDWANGFMTGFGVTDSALRPEENALFHDLAKIGGLRVDESDEAEDTLEGSEPTAFNPEGEAYYVELLEFVRMIPVSVATGRVRKAVAKLPLIAGFAMDRPIGRPSKEEAAHLDYLERVGEDDELAWETEKDTNDDFVTHMVIDAMNGKRPS